MRDLAAAVADCTVAGFWRLAGGRYDGDVLWTRTGTTGRWRRFRVREKRANLTWFPAPSVAQRIAWCYALLTDSRAPSAGERRASSRRTFHTRIGTRRQQAGALQDGFFGTEFLVYIVTHDGSQGIEAHTLSPLFRPVPPHDLPNVECCRRQKAERRLPNPPGALNCCTLITSTYCNRAASTSCRLGNTQMRPLRTVVVTCHCLPCARMHSSLSVHACTAASPPQGGLNLLPSGSLCRARSCICACRACPLCLQCTPLLPCPAAVPAYLLRGLISSCPTWPEGTAPARAAGAGQQRAGQ